MTDTYICPRCHEEYQASFATPIPVAVRWGCPACQNLYGITVWLEKIEREKEEVAA